LVNGLGWGFTLWGVIGLLLFGDVFLLALLTLLFAFLAILSLLLLISVLSVLLWGSWLEVLLVVVVLVATLVLIALRSLVTVVLHLVLVPWLTLHLWLSEEHLWLLSIEVKALNLSLHSNWSWAQIFVWVEASEGSHLSKAGDLDERWWLRVQWAELEWADGGA